MTTDPGRQWSIATGYGAVLCGIGAVMLDRPWPADSTALPDFLAQSRIVVIWQGLLFVLGAGFFMWFLGSLRMFLIRVEPVPGRVTMIAFVWMGWVAALAAACCTALVFSLIDPTGPIAPQGWLSYALHPVPVVWLTAAPTIMLLDARRRPAEMRIRFGVTA